MPDESNQEHPSKIEFTKFVNQVIASTKTTSAHTNDYDIVKNLVQHLEHVEEAFAQLSATAEKKKIASSGVEWFLDNYFVIQEAAEIIQDDLPEDYFQQLPSINSKTRQPRIYYLARNIIAHYRIELSQNDLDDFLTAYQTEIALKMSELWALPLMLRLGLVELIAETIFKLVDDQAPLAKTSAIVFPDIDPNEIIARALRTLIFFDRIDWKTFFESHSRVHKILSNDPEKVFTKMDFSTRDLYRKTIEEFSKHSSQSEIEIAQMAISLAEDADEKNKKAQHVGYFLIGNGKGTLQSAVGYQSDFGGQLKKFFFDHNTAFYLGGVISITTLVMVVLILTSSMFIDHTWKIILLGILSSIPASSVAVNLINSILTAALQPNILPKMDFRRKVPKKFRTMVAIPALLTNAHEIKFLLHQIELHYLSNKDKNIGFILLTDYPDADQETLPEDEELLLEAIDGINTLNDQYQGDDGRRPFFMFHRCRQYNPREGLWLGWERKRGKLADFNRYLVEGFDECLDTIVGELDFLKRVRFVITVDSDTILPRDGAKSLIAALAHPLNRPEFEGNTTNVASGYTILQPRTEVKPTSVNKSLFTRIFAGDLGLDLYTRAVSDIYQDLFYEGIYVGKGIYDVQAFQRSLKDKVPDNALLSHDLYEGLQGRAALVSDIVFFEEYPPDYASQVTRLHRWVRGDWQLLPWLLPKVPTKNSGYEMNSYSTIDKWKIFDNLRRSLLSPTVLLTLITGWLFFNHHGWVWTGLILFVSAFPLFNSIVTSLSSRFIMGAKANILSNIKTAFLRWLFWIIFLPYESLIMIDSVITTLIRVFISHERLLQWQTSAHTIRVFGKQRRVATIWQRMISAPLISLAIGVLLYLSNSTTFWHSLPLLIFWGVSPQFAFWISLPRTDKKKTPLSKSEIQKLRSVARRTWLYFERFIGPEDHWLPPDHFQEDPKGTIAHRTSPTNIGLLLLSSAAAYDFGYIGILDFVYRMNYAFETMDGLEKYRGHLLNWYDTSTLETLSPRYVSTVDSGNFAVSLIGLYQTLGALPESAACPADLFQGAFDSLDVFCEVIHTINNHKLNEVIDLLHLHCRNIQDDILNEPLTDNRKINLLSDFKQRLLDPMNVLIKEITGTEKAIDPAVLQDIRYWSEVIFKHLMNIQRQIEILAPWIQTWHERPKFIDEVAHDRWHEIFSIWYEDQALQTPLSDFLIISDETVANIDLLLSNDDSEVLSWFDQSQRQTLNDWLNKFTEGLQDSRQSIREFFDQVNLLKEKINFYIERMEFGFLFDKQREVFYLGYQVGSGRLDKNHYDLLASEARTASLFAIAQNNVPRSHWLHLSRPFTSVKGIPTLVSWNGSMFEYIMPNLYTRTYPETLLHQTAEGVVKSQIAYAKQNKVPWGISESSYYQFDQADNYQYKGFGVPELGRKRGLANDLVIAPYASLMSIEVDPHAVLNNLTDLEGEGALGHFGYYESIDYTPSRLPVDQKKAIIKSYMAHHQGMILVALANFLNPTGIVDRVHNDPRIQTTELLLQEQIPEIETSEKTKDVQVSKGVQDSQQINAAPWDIEINHPNPSAHVISNGNLRMIMTDSGSGYLALKDIALTRWRKDGTLDPWGIWFYIEDMDDGRAWSIGKQPIQTDAQEYRVVFSSHMTEIRHVEGDIRAILQTTIAPRDEICLQKITLTNQTDKKRHLRVLSYGEVVLAAQSTDRQHPAFNKMFIESTFHEQDQMLHFRRRKRSSKEESRGMAHALVDEIKGSLEYETDRRKFIGRGRDLSNPIVITNHEKLSGTEGTTLDPIFSIAKYLSLEPNQTKTLTFLTIAAENSAKASQVAQNYNEISRIDNAFASAESHSEKLLRALEMEGVSLNKFQNLFSYVIYPTPKLRAEPAITTQNTLPQSGLWPFGISGDYPILLVLIDHKEALEKLQEILLAHAYWRKMGMMIDLIILNSKDAGYTHELGEKIHQAIQILDSQNWVNRRGGIFVLTASQIAKDALHLIMTAGNVIIDLKTSDLNEHLNQAAAIETHLPIFVASRPNYIFESKNRIERPDDLIMDNGIGGFSPDGKEYQIYLQSYPKSLKELGQIPPAPWINVIANQDFGFLVSESGSGFSWAVNSGENRLSPWINDPVCDPSGESLYLRDEITGKIWTATPLPAGEGSDYLVKHGQGYTIFQSFNNGFWQKLKLFVDAEKPVKIIELTLRNESNEHRRITATYYVEWVLGAHREGTSAFIVPNYDVETGSLLARNTHSTDFSQRVAFLSSNQPVHGLTTDRTEFLGSPGSRNKPEGLKRVGLSGEVKSGVDACAALQTHLNFEPGEEKSIIFILGQGADIEESMELAKTFSQPETIQNSWAGVQQKWDAILNTLQVETPQIEMDLMLNRWLEYQALSCRIWGRSAFYQSSGAYGYRDQLQDVISILATQPNLVREHILRAAKHQFDAGDVLHWWHPPSGRGVRTRITDDLLWLVYVTVEYVNKTGDMDILEENITFKVGKPLEENEEERYGHYEDSEKAFTLFEHCRRALAKGDTRGPHGLPLIGSGDWNDGMNRVGIEGLGESVWLAWFLCECHQRFADLCEMMNDQSSAKEHRKRAEELKEITNQVAWDDEWYLRGYYDDGTPLGSHLNEECQIDSLPQSWSILTNGAPEERQNLAIKSVEKYLVSEKHRIIRLFTPPFDKTKKDPGYIKGYPPGIRENGGQYTHAAIWAVWALTKLGQGSKAYEQFDFLNPITHSLNLEDANRYAVEPYVVAADIYSTPPFTGRGGWTWYTGSSGWLYRLGMEAILGFELQGDHFSMNPCIPESWDGFRLTYKRENCTYEVKVINPEHVEKGVRQIMLDGEMLEGQHIPIHEDHSIHQVTIVMGK